MGHASQHLGGGTDEQASAATSPPLWRSPLKLCRPVQWSKSAFVLIGPAYGLRDVVARGDPVGPVIMDTLLAAAAFALASSGCYVLNDLSDRVADRAHPRKRRRPIAAGLVNPRQALALAVGLFVLAGLLVLLVGADTRGWVALTAGLYVANVMLYSAYFKHKVIADVMSLALGFVLRVMGGCAAAGVEPSVWLLNVTFFLSMFLAFGKRLGERRTLSREPGSRDARGGSVSGGSAGSDAGAVAHRRVQAGYTDTLLQMAVVVTAVSTLLTYGSYVQSQSLQYVLGFNLLWLTMLPAFYGLFRCIVKVEQGVYDDPTELAVHDRGFQVAALAFVCLSLGIMVWTPGASARAGAGRAVEQQEAATGRGTPVSTDRAGPAGAQPGQDSSLDR
jgi:decaprenyl-phosphate phosphoribosyltransferase